MPELSRPLGDAREDGFDLAADLDRLRTEAPISRTELPTGGSAWLVTGYAEVRAILGDPVRFSSAGTRRPETGSPCDLPGSFHTYDPPEHTRLRGLVTPEFTLARIRRLAPRVEAIVTGHMDAMELAGAPADLIPMFALPIPSLVICELLGVPETDRADFQRRSRTRVDLRKTAEERREAKIESRVYLADLVARLRRDPGQDLLGMLIREHGNEVSDVELIGIADLLLAAGHETTSNVLGLGTLLLLRNSDQFALLRDHPEVGDRAIEELLRYQPVTESAIARTATEDVTIAGRTIMAGDEVVCSLQAANRDTVLGEHLDRLDLTRKACPHVAFGHGIHHCLGAPLARMQMRIAFPALLRRFPNLRLAVPFEELRFREHSLVYGLHALPVTW